MQKLAYLIVGVLIFMTSHVALAAPLDVFTVTVDCNSITITWDHSQGASATLLLQVDGNLLISEPNLPLTDSRHHIFVPKLKSGAFVATMVQIDNGDFGEWRGKLNCDVPSTNVISQITL